MPACQRHSYDLKDNDAEPFLLRIDVSYSHGENVMAGMMNEHHVAGPCPACGTTDSLQFYEDDDTSPFVLSIDARGTYFCNSCEASFIDEQFYKDVFVPEYPFPFDAKTVAMLVSRLQCFIANYRVASDEHDDMKMTELRKVGDSIHSYLIACFKSQNNKGVVEMFSHLTEQFSEKSITEDMFLSSLRILLLPENNNAASINLPDDLVS